MKRFLLLTVLVSVFSLSCEKDEKDERDQFVGTYSYTLVAVGQDGGGQYNFTNTGTLDVYKGPGAIIGFDFGEGLDMNGGLLEDQKFNLETDLFDFEGDIYEVAGNGFFGNNTIQITMTLEGQGFFDNAIYTFTGTKQ